MTGSPHPHPHAGRGRPLASAANGGATRLRRSGEAWRIAWQAGKVLALLDLAITLISGLLPAAATWLTKVVMDAVAGDGAGRLLIAAAIGLAAVGLANALVPQLTTFIRAERSRRMDAHLQDRLYAAVTSFDGLSRFESPAFRDRLSLATQATGGTLGTIAAGLQGVGRDVIVLVSLVATLWLLNPVMAVVVMAAGIPVLLAQVWISRKRVGARVRMTPDLRRQVFYSSLIMDTQAAKEVRLLGLGELLRGRLRDGITSVHATNRQVDRTTLVLQGALALLGATVSGAGLVWVIGVAGTRQLGVGDVSAFIAAVAGVQSAITGLVSQLTALAQALLVFSHHGDVSELPNDLPVVARPRSLPPLRQGIELRDIWFRYEEGLPWVLRGVSLTIPAGCSLGLVGANGAGKSTLVKLLCRFYDPTRGSILWDGIDLREVLPGELRQRLGVLFQDFMKYDFTASDNVGLGDLRRLDDREAIRAAAIEAGVDEALDALPQGYDTLLSRMFAPDESGKAGVLLSGGQWQRLALARALLRTDRDLLILDEPSAGLDPQAEHDVHRRLQQSREGRTSLLVSHRLSTIREADSIAVVDRGRVAEVGSHGDLMAEEGLYARMFTVQASGYASDAVPVTDRRRAAW
jgi:ATP-binding cassette, subfamily B, bacterial